MTTQKPKTPDTPTPPEAASGVTLTALTPIEHDGQRYETGSTLTVPTAQASPLLAIGAAQVSTPVAE